MWEDCDSWDACDHLGAVVITAEPTEWIPLHVLYKQSRIKADDFIGDMEQNPCTVIVATNTAKFFFPDMNLVDGLQYFLSLEFSVQVRAYAEACYGDTYVSMYAGASLGPHIIDTQIIKNGDFGNCQWMDPDVDGCRLFDRISADNPFCAD
jgi:hypothetical protein